jgi:HD-like signal output (HDOD) protein
MPGVSIATPPRVDYQELALRSLSQLPPFSPILNRLLATLGHEDVSFSDIANLIEKDTVLTGQILRLVNSAAYGRRGTINSVRHAISMLGVNKLRNSVLGFSISRLWIQSRIPEPWSSARFNLHSVATGILADLIAQRAPVDYAEGAFVAGVLHDLGQMVIALSLPDQYQRIRRLYELSKASIRDCEREILGFSHEHLGAAALQRWNLPEPIREGVASHHDPGPMDLRCLHLAHVLRAADTVVNRFGISVLPQEDVLSLPENYPELEEVGLTENHIMRILADFNTEFEAIRAFF